MAAIVALWFLFHAGAAEAQQSEHNSVLLFSAFTGQAPETSRGGGGSNGSEGSASGPLHGHPTPRQAMTKAMAAFAATGWTPMTGMAPGEQWCSLDTYGANAYLPGDATGTVRVTCRWRAYRATSSTAGITIDVSLPAADLQLTFDSRGHLEANAGIVMDLPLYNAVVFASASK